MIVPPIVVRAPASTSNLGAGFDCLGLALDLWLEARLVEEDGPPEFTGTLAGLEPDRDVMSRLLRERGVLDGRRILAHSSIPVSRGLGSSAAATGAALALAQQVRKADLDRTQLFENTYAEEGHPDNAGPAVFGGLVLYADHPVRLPIAPDIGIALAVPDVEVRTEAARQVLSPTVTRHDAVSQAARCAALVTGLRDHRPDAIASGMEDRIALPLRKHLIPGFEAAVEAGRAAGAYGVTISGSGSTLLAVCSRDRSHAVAEAMARAICDAGCSAVPLVPGIATSGIDVEQA